jgi:phosphatidylserine decarboxylase
MKLPFAKYGMKEIVFSLALCAGLGVLLGWVNLYLLSIPAVVFLFVLYFFRDPERKVPEGNNTVVSPADGTVIEISDVKEDGFIKEECVKIAIFLSVFNVHINRAPMEGKVEWIDYRKGKFLVASVPDASSQNESNSIGMVDAQFKVLVRQVSGIIARRIVCAVKPGEAVQKGQRIGMIKFGSRTELFIPKKNVESIEVKLKDKVKGAKTIMAKVKGN